MTSAQSSGGAAIHLQGRIVAIVMSGLALAVVGPAYVTLVGHSPMTVLALHGLTSAIMFGAATYMTLRRRNAGDVFHAAGWFLLAGPLGSLIALVAIVGGSDQNARINLRAFLEQEMAAPPIAEANDLARAIRDNRVRLSGATEIASFRDTLSGQDQRAKLKTLSVLSREYRPEFAAALHLALRDTDAAVRVLAAGVLSRLQEEFGGRLEKLERAVNLDSTSAAARRALAAEHVAYSESGLLSPERQRLELDRAEQLFATCADSAPDAASLHLVPKSANLQATKRSDNPSGRRLTSRVLPKAVWQRQDTTVARKLR